MCTTASSVMFAVVAVCVCEGEGKRQHKYLHWMSVYNFVCMHTHTCEGIMSSYTNHNTTQGRTRTHEDRNASNTIHSILTRHHMWNTVTYYIVQVSELCCWAREKHTEALEYGAHVVHTWSTVLHWVLPV